MAAFRCAVGALCVYVVIRRWITLPIFYSRSGAYPVEALGPAVTWQAGPLRFITSDAGLHCAFAVCLLVALAFTAGLATRVVRWLLLPAIWTVNGRTPMLFTGGEAVLQLQCLYVAFLPVSRVFSLDAWLRAREQADAPALATPQPNVVRSPAYALVLVQLAVIYLFNALAKFGDTWRQGSAVAHALGAATLVSDFGGWVAQLPPPLLRALTYGTLVIEGVLPLLILSPWARRQLHLVAAALIVSLHGGILVAMEVGIFSAAMMAHLPLLWQPRRASEHALEQSPRERRGRAVLVLGLAYLLFARLSHDQIYYPARPQLWLPGPLEQLTRALGLVQPWMMFAPDPPSRDFIIVTDAVTRSGRHFDPWRLVASDRLEPLKELPRSVVRAHAYTRYENFLSGMGVHSKLHPFFARWLLAQRLPSADPNGDPVERFDAWLLVVSTNPHDVVKNEELERRVGVLPLQMEGALPVHGIDAVGVWAPERAVDGKIVPDGTHVFTPVSANMGAACPRVTLDLGSARHVKSAFLQADTADHFVIEGSLDGTQFRALGEMPPVEGRHHRSRVINLAGEAARFVRIRPKRSRGMRHMLSEVALFEHVVSLPVVPVRRSQGFLAALERPAAVGILSGANHPSPDCPAEAVAKH